MSKRRSPVQKASHSTKTSVRGFLNLAAPLPDFGAEEQKDTALVGPLGGRGLLYGHGNTVPVVAMAAAQQSGTAYRCLERRAQFLEGIGFPTPARDPHNGQLLRLEEAGTMGETPVPGHNGLKTANDLWAELCSYGSYNNAAAVLVRYNNGSTIGEIHVLPFGSVRKTASGTYLLNHKFGRKGFKSTDTTEHLPFDDSKKTVLAVLRKAKEIDPKTKKPYGQPGQIFYIYTPKAGEEDCPLPPHWAGLEAVLADASYARFELDEVDGGFTSKGILAMLGQQNNTVVDEDGETEQERTDEELKLFTGAGARAAGVRRKSILVLDVATKDALPVWIPMNTTVDLKYLSEKKEAIGQEVCRHIGIPPVLVGFAKPGQLGNVQELTNTVQYTQTTLEPLRKLLLRAFWRLMPSLSGLVPGKLNPIEVATTITQQTQLAQP